jgi:hypothetical protein
MIYKPFLATKKEIYGKGKLMIVSGFQLNKYKKLDSCLIDWIEKHMDEVHSVRASTTPEDLVPRPSTHGLARLSA